MEYFNKYGAVPIGGPIENAASKIADIGDALYKEMAANGASPVEIRAAAEYLGFAASGVASHVIMKIAAEKRRKEREEQLARKEKE